MARNSDADEVEPKNAKSKLKITKPEAQGCLVCEHGIHIDLGWKRTVECRQTVLPASVSGSLRTVRFDADATSLMRAGVQRRRHTHTNCGLTPGSGRHGSQKRHKEIEAHTETIIQCVPSHPNSS